MSIPPSASTSGELRIGLAGVGTVGAAVLRNLERNRNLIEGRSGRSLRVVRAVVRDLASKRDAPMEGVALSTELNDLVTDPQVDVVVELIGGVEAAGQLVVAALEAGKSVVTGNKALLAERGPELLEVAGRSGAKLVFEAAVAGGIPVIKSLHEGLAGNHIESIYGILNGTSNYILTRMAEEPVTFREALAEASALGYAEADPTLDVSGWDAAHKAVILASLSYGRWLSCDSIEVRGIDQITPLDSAFAAQLGYQLKLLSVIKAREDGTFELRTGPALVPAEHILADVSGVDNAVAMRGDVVGETVFIGPGAGGDATASAVIADLVDLARDGTESHREFRPHELYREACAIEDCVTGHYLRIPVNDEPGVIAAISAILAELGIGIQATASQKPSEMPDGKFLDVILLTHAASFGDIRTAIGRIEQLDCVTAPVLQLPVEEP